MFTFLCVFATNQGVPFTLRHRMARLVAEKKMTWAKLRRDLKLVRAGREGTVPASTSPSDWSAWTSRHSYSVRFRGRNGMRSVGPLDLILKRLATSLHEIYVPPDSVFGFVRGRSTLSAAKVHVGAESALTVDLKDFFGQIDEVRVRTALGELVDKEALDFIVGCCVLSTGLPIGFRTSPVISNLVFHTTDRAIEEFCDSRSVAYTRWADDLVFSGNRIDDVFLDDLTKILFSLNWVPNDKKTRFMSTKRVVLGLNVAKDLDRPHVPRKMKKELRKQVYYLSRFGTGHFSNQDSWPMPRILGTIAYVKSVDPTLASSLGQQLAKLPEASLLMGHSGASGGGKWQLSLLQKIGL